MTSAGDTAMLFPIDLRFERLGWHVKLAITDASGRVIGYAPLLGGPKQRFTVYSDRSLSGPLYVIGADNPYNQWFETAQGARLGHFGSVTTAAGRFVHVGSEPRFSFEDDSPGLSWIDVLMPGIPVLNALFGALVQPRLVARRAGTGEAVLSIVKTRLAFDLHFRIHEVGELTALERECLLLAAIVRCSFDLPRRW
jgi:hypothetical protein